MHDGAGRQLRDCHHALIAQRAGVRLAGLIDTVEEKNALDQMNADKDFRHGLFLAKGRLRMRSHNPIVEPADPGSQRSCRRAPRGWQVSFIC